MTAHSLETSASNTWCPGCGNFAILNTAKTVLQAIGDEVSPENLVLVSGIGCHGKIVDYLNVNSFYGIHGRMIPVATGIKLANPDLKVIGFAGDGDAYGEGLEHLIFAAKRNIDLTVIIHNNRIYSLTTGQYSPTSPLGFPGRSTPAGSPEPPLNPLELLLAGGATFLARGFSSEPEQMRQILTEAINHQGFALVDILQVCVTFLNLHQYYAERVYTVHARENHDPTDYSQALSKIREWDYGAHPQEKEGRIPLGVLYKREAPTFSQRFLPTGGEKIRGEGKEVPVETGAHVSATIEKILANSR